MYTLVGNENVITLSWQDKMSLLLNSKKMGQPKTFWFWHFWVTWQRCLECPQHTTGNFVYFNFFCNSLKFSNSNKTILTTTHNHLSYLAVLKGGATQKSSHHQYDGWPGHSGCQIWTNGCSLHPTLPHSKKRLLYIYHNVTYCPHTSQKLSFLFISCSLWYWIYQWYNKKRCISVHIPGFL